MNAAPDLKQACPASLELSDADLRRLPETGAVLILAGRPYGLVEGSLLLPALRRRRPDLRVLEDAWLEAAGPEGVTLGPGDAGRRRRRAEEELRRGGAVLAFVDAPLATGRTAHPKALAGAAAFVSLALATGASIQALRISGGRRQPWIKALGLAKPGLRRKLLAPALPGAQARLRASLSACLAAPRLAALGDERAAAEHVALRFWLLARREGARPRAKGWRRAWRHRRMEPLAVPGDRDSLRAELAALPAGARLAQAGDLEVWCAEAPAIPALLKEIGLRREEAFRAVGEGSGQALDLDRFDPHYLHLFLWHRGEARVVGGYRFVPVDRAIAAQGLDGLYSHGLLRYKPDLLARLEPAVELGRSFVSPDFQRSYAPLLLLWRGLGAWLAANPRYRRLFGLVSMSGDYQPISREILASFIKQHHYRADLAGLTRPRRPFGPAYAPGRHDQLTWRLGGDLEEISRWIGELEPAGNGLPVLFRHYAGLGGFFFGFNVDPDFGGALDGLVCVDLLEADPRMLSRSMGPEQARTWLAHQGQAAAA